jgi:hypothetical protein
MTTDSPALLVVAKPRVKPMASATAIERPLSGWMRATMLGAPRSPNASSRMAAAPSRARPRAQASGASHHPI